MSVARGGIVLQQIDRLFGEGTLTGLGDGQLLERYLTRRDEDAFGALVDLHGPMVLGLCRRMLRDPRDIEDAFQATFLVLVRKAPSIRDRDLLSSWLYGVAYRIARRARARALRHRDREATVGVPQVAAEPEASEQLDMDPMLDQELGRLPERYRAPLVLCYLRGRTHEQAAEDLRCPVGTVRSRLARGRDLLRKRLTRRGFAPTAMGALLGVDVTLPVRLLVAPVPPPMAAAAVRAAVAFGSSSLFKAGAAAASSVVLARGVLMTMKLSQLNWIGLAALATGLSAGGVVAVGVAAEGQQGAESPPPASTTDSRLSALEDKIDRLINRLGMPPTSAVVTEMVVRPNAAAVTKNMEGSMRSGGQSGATDQPSRSGQARPMTAAPIRELEAQLKAAIMEFDRVESLLRRAVISQGEFELARSKVLIIVARLGDLDEAYQDELERLKLDRRRKVAQLDRSRAEWEGTAAVVAKNRRLNDRKPNMVDVDEVAKAEARYKAASADVEIAKVDLDEIEWRFAKLQGDRARITEIVRLADPVKEGSARGVPPSDKPRP